MISCNICDSRVTLISEWSSLIEAVEKAEEKLKLMTEDAEICENCDNTFKKSKPLRLHTRQDHEDEDDKTFNSPGSGDKNKITLSNSDFRVDLERQDLKRKAHKRIMTKSKIIESNLERKAENRMEKLVIKEDEKTGYKAIDERSINENETIEGEPDQQHEDSGLDGNNDKDHKDQSCRSGNGENENKDGENKDSENENKTMEEVSCESTTKAREDLDLLPEKNMSSVRQDVCLLSVQGNIVDHQLKCDKCSYIAIHTNDLRRHKKILCMMSH